MTENDVKFMHTECEAGSPYHYRECGLSNIWLVSGYEEEEFDGECYVSVRDADSLHRQIALHIIHQKSALKGEQIRFLRKEMDLTQSELASLLNVSAQSVARWEKDQADVPGPANVLIRVICLDDLTGEVEALKLAQELQSIDDMNEENITLAFELTEGWQSSVAA